MQLRAHIYSDERLGRHMVVNRARFEYPNQSSQAPYKILIFAVSESDLPKRDYWVSCAECVFMLRAYRSDYVLYRFLILWTTSMTASRQLNRDLYIKTYGKRSGVTASR